MLNAKFESNVNGVVEEINDHANVDTTAISETKFIAREI